MYRIVPGLVVWCLLRPVTTLENSISTPVPLESWTALDESQSLGDHRRSGFPSPVETSRPSTKVGSDPVSRRWTVLRVGGHGSPDRILTLACYHSYPGCT